MFNQFAGGPSISEKEPSFDPLSSVDEENIGKESNNISKPTQDLYGTTYKGVELGEKNDENIPNQQETIEEGKLDDSKHIPILTGLLDSGNINLDLYNETRDKINKLGLNGKDEVSKIISDVIDLSLVDEKTKSLLNNQLSGPEEVREEDFEKTPFAEHKDLLGLDKGIGGLELMLAENYIEIPKQNGEVDIKQNLATTMNITLNKILETKTPEFKQNNAVEIGIIRAPSGLEDIYKNLQKIHKEDLIEDAKFGGKKGQKEIIQKTKILNSKIKDFNQRFEKAKNDNTEQGKDKLIADLKKEYNEIMKEKEEKKVFEGDIFVAGKEDKAPDIKEEDPFALI